MILKNITLENIRSYKDKTVIDFPYGRTLFQGDIGSGKSTILSAVEFALFGLGDIDANHLLRVGATTGSVFLEFESNKQHYKVFRSLSRRRDKIIQNEGYLYENGTKSSYSVSELKTKILDIIKINERTETKTTSVVYRYAVYTPQEMMKQILSSNSEKRLDILRRAFGIEEYSTAKRNAEKFLSGIRVLLRTKKDLVVDLDDYKSTLKNKNELISNTKNDVKKLSYSVEALEQQLRTLDMELSQLVKIKEQLLELELAIRSSKISLAKCEKDRNVKIEETNRLNQDLARAANSEKIVLELGPRYKDLISNRSELTTLADCALQYDRLISEKLRLETQIKNEKEKLFSEAATLKNDIDELGEQLEREQVETSKLDTLLLQESILSEKAKGMDLLRKNMEDVTGTISQAMARMRAVEKEVSKEETEINKILELSHQAVCPCCGQRLTPEHISEMVKKFNHNKELLEADCSGLKEEIKVSEGEKKELASKINELEGLNSELHSIKVKISGLRVIKSSLDAISERMREKIIRLDILNEKSESNNQGDREKAELGSISGRLESLSNAKIQYENCQNTIAIYQKDNLEKRYLDSLSLAQSKGKTVEHLESIQKTVTELDKEIDGIQAEIPKLESSCKLKKSEVEKLPQIESEKLTIVDRLSMQRQELAVKNSIIKDTQEHIVEIEKKIESLEKKFEGLQYMENVGRWFDECFIPSLDIIETHFMATINEGFGHLFQKWFNLLVDSPDIIVELDQCFAPVVHQNGHMMEVNTLSGGEKTAVAMAYRLALNEVIKRLANMDDNLLILDEPTDGFSKEQMYQLKYVFDGLNASQVI
ncbi:MAG TPA: SMC family ATPase, partial [Nitrososphaeraceae archaeon]|nr:SMC family ATPase [Nitrososphaeraceae archaeon]